jgi:hypothetical protein
MRDNGERLVREPFKGLTTDGEVIPDLYPLKTTGVSTDAIRRATAGADVTASGTSWPR